MDQLIFKFPFSKKYYEQDFFVSSNNFSAYKLIESWPTWPGKWLNIFGDSGSGKTHLSKILEKKIKKIKLIDAKNIDNQIVQNLNNIDCLIIDSWPNWSGKWLNIFGESGSGKTHLSKILEKKIKKTKMINAENIDDKTIEYLSNFDCLIIENFNNNIDEYLLYSILNQSKQLDNFLLINSRISIKNYDLKLIDLKSRLNSFVFIGIDLPNDDLLKVMITKSLSDKQISISPKLSDYIINNVERSYEKMIKFIKDLDELSLSTGKSININLIKKVLKK